MRVESSKSKINPSTIVIIVLSILLIASMAIGVTLAYFSSTSTVIGNVTLGNPVNINITQGGASVTSLTFGSDALPGHVYDQAIAVNVLEGTSDALLRAKLVITNNDGATINIQASTVNTWIVGEDEYYYYNGIATEGDEVEFVTAVTIPTSITNADANKTFNIEVVVEAIQEANNAARSVWTTAPSEWLDTYNPVIVDDDNG